MTYDRATGWTATFRGVVAAAATPMRADGEVDLERVHDLVELLVDGGVAAIMVGGTTGEFVALTTAERVALVAAATAAVAGRVRVIAHVGHIDLRGARELTHAAIDAGADGVTALTPYYHRVSERAIEAFVRDLLAIAPEHPFFVYDYPDAAGTRFPHGLFQILLSEPNLAGIKCSVGTLAELEAWLRFADDVCVMSGNDGLLRPFVARGGRAIVSGNATAFPEVVVAAFDAASAGRDGDVALAALDDVVAAGGAGAPDRLKVLLAARGLDIGPARIRTHTPDDLPAHDEARVRGLTALVAHVPAR